MQDLKQIENEVHKMTMKTILSIAIWSGLLLGPSLQAQEINNNSHWELLLIEPFIKAFNEETGIETHVLYFKEGLSKHLKTEGRNSAADVVLNVEIARLSAYNSLGLLA